MKHKQDTLSAWTKISLVAVLVVAAAGILIFFGMGAFSGEAVKLNKVEIQKGYLPKTGTEIGKEQKLEITSIVTVSNTISMNSGGTVQITADCLEATKKYGKYSTGGNFFALGGSCNHPKNSQLNTEYSKFGVDVKGGSSKARDHSCDFFVPENKDKAPLIFSASVICASLK